MLDHLAPLPDTPTCALVTNAWACPRTQLLADGYCILHSPNPSKNVSDFGALIRKQIDNHEFDFRRYIFPAGYKLPGTVYGRADFTRAEFTDHTSFSGCVFDQAVYFNDATFHGEVNLSGASFQGHASFQAATFIRGLDARLVQFDGGASFENVRFEGTVRFEGANFAGATSFARTVFRSPAAFEKAHFRESANFSSCTFDSVSSFAEATFHENARFSSVKLAADDIRHEWRQCTFHGGVSLNDGASLRDLDLSGSTFHGPVLFDDATIHSIIVFNGCTFHDELVINATAFLGVLSFYSCVFQGSVVISNIGRPPADLDFQDIRFGGSTFKQRLTFEDSQVHAAGLSSCTFEDVWLIRTTFWGNVHFGRSKFEGQVITHDVVFNEFVRFEGASLPDGHAFQGIRFAGVADFAGTDLDGINFRQMDLANSRFANSINLAKAEFDDVTWAAWPARGGDISFAVLELLRQSAASRWDSWAEQQRHRHEWSRIATADELDARQPGLDANERRKRLRTAERVYRGLRASHETHKDHPRACDFYFAEMEMRRLAGSLNPLSPHRDLLTPLYALLSGYGENWRRAAGWFLALWVVCAVVYLAVGLSVKVSGPRSETDSVLQVVLVPVGGPTWVADCLRLACSPGPIGNAMLHSLYVASFVGRDIHAIVSPGIGESVQFVELLLGPLFLAFGALAIRRRFQR